MVPAVPTEVQFTGKERDGETGLDYFEIRYYSGTQGRFTSPDNPGFGDPSDPQSWNLFSYGLNNPLRFSDPSGHEPCENGVNPENGNICVVKTDQAPKVDPAPSGVGILDLSWTFTKVILGSANQGTQQLIQGTMDYVSLPRDPGCMAGYAATGSGVGFWDGGGLGSLGLVTGPGAAITIPGGAAGGAALGGGIAGLGGLVMCVTGGGRWGGDGGRGRDRAQGNNESESKAFYRAIEEIEKKLGKGKLTAGQVRRIHDEITGQGFGKDQIVEEGLKLFQR